mmetsp:Transcript_39804/g.123523  ORF Transcript_39804/g.123523 Transcript_39804/m.123523 type:complete len:248 (-) Transcript_39804:807-1550(-)
MWSPSATDRSSSRMQRTRPSTCSLPRRPASTCRTMASISLTLTLPLPSRSKALKAYHRCSGDIRSLGLSAPATNSWRFTVLEPSRSSREMTPSRLACSSSLKRSSFCTAWQISGTPRTPSPFRSKTRKALSMFATSRDPNGSCCAMTLMTMRLKCPLLAFSWMLRSSRSRRALGSRSRCTFSHGCLSNALAVGRSPGFTLSIWLTASLASADSSAHSSPYSTLFVLTCSTRLSSVAAQCGGTPVSMW